jgi:hypothetical protein
MVGEETSTNEDCLLLAHMLVSCLAFSSVMKIEEICSSERSVAFHRNTRCYIPEDSSLYNHRYEDFKSYLRKQCIFPKHLYPSTRLHGVRIQNTNICIITVFLVFLYWRNSPVRGLNLLREVS